MGLGRLEIGPATVGDKIAPIIGAAPGEVLACDSTTIVLAYSPRRVLACGPTAGSSSTTSSNFPTDLYVVEGLAWLAGDLEVKRVEPWGARRLAGRERGGALPHPRRFPHR